MEMFEQLESRVLASVAIAPCAAYPTHSQVMGPFASQLTVGSRANAPGQIAKQPPTITPVLPPTRTIVTLADPTDMTPVTLPPGSSLWGDNQTADPSDVEQGGYGFCWGDGPFMAMALANPSTIMKQIQPDGHGGFFIFTDSTTAYDVDATYFDVYENRIGSDHAFWPLLLEKYIAERMGGYSRISGNWMSTAAFYMGWTVDGEAMPTTVDALSSWVETNLAALKTITLGSGSSTSDGVVANHCYFIDGVSVVNGVTYFQLDQPWKYQTYRLQLTFEQFTNFYYLSEVIS